MVRITYRPTQEIVILDRVEYPTVDDLVKNIILVAKGIGQTGVLSWTGGVLFAVTPLLPENEKLMGEYLRGRTYISNVIFSLMPHYTDSIRKNGMEIPVIDVTPNPTMRRIASWLKKTSRSRAGKRQLKIKDR
jgi:hypothetical protein